MPSFRRAATLMAASAVCMVALYGHAAARSTPDLQPPPAISMQKLARHEPITVDGKREANSPKGHSQTTAAEEPGWGW